MYITWGILNVVYITTSVKPLHNFVSGLNDKQFLLSPVYRLYCVKAGALGGVVVKALHYKRQVAGSTPDGVNGIFQ